MLGGALLIKEGSTLTVTVRGNDPTYMVKKWEEPCRLAAGASLGVLDCRDCGFQHPGMPQ